MNVLYAGSDTVSNFKAITRFKDLGDIGYRAKTKRDGLTDGQTDGQRCNISCLGPSSQRDVINDHRKM